MGDIIKIDFNTGKRAPTKENRDKADGTKGSGIIDAFKRLIESISADKNTGTDLLLRWNEFTQSEAPTILNSLPCSANSLVQSRGLVSRYSDTELMDWITTSTKNDWQIKPAFYRAVYEELSNRIVSQYLR